MKKMIFLPIFIAIALTLIGQQQKTKEQDQSNAEKFSSRSGTLIQKEFIDIGDVKKCELKVVKYTDLISGQKTSALKFEYEYKSSYTSDTKAAVLDADEIDGLLKSIKLIKKKIFPIVPDNYTEVSFGSRSGFEAGCFKSKKDWSTYMKLEKYDSNSYVFMDKDDLDKLQTLLEQAKLKL